MYVYFLKEKISNHAYIKDSEFTSYYTPRTNDKALKNLALAMNEIEVKRQIIQVQWQLFKLFNICMIF